MDPKTRAICIPLYLLLALLAGFWGVDRVRPYAREAKEAVSIDSDDRLRERLYGGLAILSLAPFAALGTVALILRRGPPFHHATQFWFLMLGIKMMFRCFGEREWLFFGLFTVLALIGLAEVLTCLLRHSHAPDAPAPGQVASV